MRRLLLGVTLAALCGASAFGQVHEEPKKQGVSGDGDILSLIHISEPTRPY